MRYDWSVDGKSVRLIGDNIARDDSLLVYREFNGYGFKTLDVSYNIGQVDSVVMIYDGWKKLSEIDYDIISNNVTTNKFGTFSYTWDGLKVKKFETGKNEISNKEDGSDIGPVLNWNPQTGSLQLSQVATQKLLASLGGHVTQRRDTGLTVFFPIADIDTI